MNPELSILVATRDRARELSRCLAAIGRLDAPFPIETIVVDNGSSDGTRDRFERATAGIRGLRYVFEPEPGLSRARNRGVELARAPILVFLDDDAEPAPGWLAALRGGFAETDAAAVGGPVLARFEVEPPPWLAGLLRVLSAQDFGAARRAIDSPPYLIGANLAVRRADLEQVGGFDEAFGRRGDSLFLGEDTDLCERLLGARKLLLYEPEAVVYHWIPPERFAPRYLRRRAFDTGRSVGLHMARRLSPGELIRELTKKTAKLPLHFVVWAGARLVAERETSMLRERSMLVTLGILREVVRRSSSRASQPTQSTASHARS